MPIRLRFANGSKVLEVSFGDPVDDCTYGAPGKAHQHGDRALGTLGGQPSNLLVKKTVNGRLGAVPREQQQR